MRAATAFGFAGLVAVTGCQPTQTPQQMQARLERESAAFRETIGGVARRYGQWVGSGQVDSVANLFTEQGRQMPPNEPPAVGRAAIRERQARLASLGKWELHITPEVSLASGPLAVDRGTYTISLKPGPKAPAGVTALADTGKYLAHWHQVGGQWQMADLVWNSNLSLQPARPAATRPIRPTKRTRRK
jgi:ketosteroid isomerase-like protein